MLQALLWTPRSSEPGRQALVEVTAGAEGAAGETVSLTHVAAAETVVSTPILASSKNY